MAALPRGRTRDMPLPSGDGRGGHTGILPFETQFTFVYCEQDLAPARAALTLVDVDGDPGLAVEFGLRVPVLTLAGRVVCEGLYESPRVRDALQV